jgi:6-pyruvoyltetrahydropterin/6-carboxytetrahydropterin synthase
VRRGDARRAKLFFLRDRFGKSRRLRDQPGGRLRFCPCFRARDSPPLHSVPMRVELAKTFTFEAAHYLPCFPDGHKCRRMHGHSFRVEVVVEGEMDPAKGYLVDYGDIKKAISPVHDALDHRCLNEIPGLENPTAELLARWIWDRLKPTLPLLSQVIVCETCTSRCVYEGR